MPPVRVLVAFFYFSPASSCQGPHARVAGRLGRLLESIGGSSARRGPEPTPGCVAGTRPRASVAIGRVVVRPVMPRAGFPPSYRCVGGAGCRTAFLCASPFSVGFFHAASRSERGAAGTATSAHRGPTDGPGERLRPSSSATPTGDLRLPPGPQRVARPSCPWLADRWCERSEESTGGPIKTWRAFVRESPFGNALGPKGRVKSADRTGRFAHRPRREVFNLTIRSSRFLSDPAPPHGGLALLGDPQIR